MAVAKIWFWVGVGLEAEDMEEGLVKMVVKMAVWRVDWLCARGSSTMRRADGNRIVVSENCVGESWFPSLFVSLDRTSRDLELGRLVLFFFCIDLSCVSPRA